MNRRTFLAMLSSLPLAESIGQAASAQTTSQSDDDVVHAARVLTGRIDLSAVIISRARQYQTELDAGFAARLTTLASAIGKATPAQREQVIAALSEADAKTAIELIYPLYLGYTGSPSTVKASDNAKFVTFLDALMFEPTSDNTIRPSYARGGPNYWTAVPTGVNSPAMVSDIAEWGSKSPKASTTYAKPDPRYLALCQGHGKTLAEATAWVAANPTNTTSGETK